MGAGSSFALCRVVMLLESAMVEHSNLSQVCSPMAATLHYGMVVLIAEVYGVSSCSNATSMSGAVRVKWGCTADSTI